MKNGRRKGIKATVNTAHTSPANIFLAERQAEAVKLRKEGKTLDGIAVELGVGHATVHRYLQAYDKRAQSLTVELARAQLIEGLQDCGDVRRRFKQLINDPDPTIANMAAQRVEANVLIAAKLLGNLPAPGQLNPHLEKAMEDVTKEIYIAFKPSQYVRLADGSTIDTSKNNEVVDPPDSASEHWNGEPVKRWPQNIERPQKTAPVRETPPPTSTEEEEAARYAKAAGHPVNGGAVVNNRVALRADTYATQRSWTLEKGAEQAAKLAEEAEREKAKRKSWLA